MQFVSVVVYEHVRDTTHLDMTLQYHTPTRYFDRDWGPRLSLSHKVLSGIFDTWCRSDTDFPVTSTVAILIRVFSPAFEADRSTSEWKRSSADWLVSVDTPVGEFDKAWPNRSEADRASLIGKFQSIVSDAANSWVKRGPLEPSIDQIIQSVANELLGARYIAIQDRKSTRLNSSH